MRWTGNVSANRELRRGQRFRRCHQFSYLSTYYFSHNGPLWGCVSGQSSLLACVVGGLFSRPQESGGCHAFEHLEHICIFIWRRTAASSQVSSVALPTSNANHWNTIWANPVLCDKYAGIKYLYYGECKNTRLVGICIWISVRVFILRGGSRHTEPLSAFAFNVQFRKPMNSKSLHTQMKGTFSEGNMFLQTRATPPVPRQAFAKLSRRYSRPRLFCFLRTEPFRGFWRCYVVCRGTYIYFYSKQMLNTHTV